MSRKKIGVATTRAAATVWLAALLFVWALPATALHAREKQQHPEKSAAVEIQALDKEARDLIEKLQLEPHPAIQGGFFRQTYCSRARVKGDLDRSSGTLIYYLATTKAISTFHKLASDEILLYHGGSPGVQLLLFPDGRWEERVVGPDIQKGEMLQSLIPAGTWYSLVLADRTDGSWGLFSAMVVPGFDYADFTPGDSAELVKQYPSAEKRMKELGLL